MTALEGLRETALPGQTLFARGKVRDLYAVGDDRLLIVATDRISAFDAVLPTPIPDKGKVLNLLSAFWFRRTAETFPNHLLSTDPATYPSDLAAHAEALAGRSMLVRRTRRIDVECVARGYLAGSAWSEYRRDGTACGIPLPAGLRESEALPEPIFTPAIKAQSGHDENIPFGRLVELVGEDLAGRLRRATLDVYATAARYAAQRGIIIADTKMEFGLLPATGQRAGRRAVRQRDAAADRRAADPGLLALLGGLHLRGGRRPPSYDKQYVRDYLEGSGWNKEPPAPALPPEVVAQTRQRYVDALRRLTGSDAL